MPSRAQRSYKRRVKLGGQRKEVGRLRWQDFPSGHVAHKRRVETQVADQRFDRHEGIISEWGIRASAEVSVACRLRRRGRAGFAEWKDRTTSPIRLDQLSQNVLLK